MPSILDTILAFTFLGSVVRAVPASAPQPKRNGASGTVFESPKQIVRVPRVLISIVAQRQRLCAIIETASDSAMRALDAHGAARTHLEVAEFSLDRIFDEVGAVMDLTPTMALARGRIAGADLASITG